MAEVANEYSRVQPIYARVALNKAERMAFLDEMTVCKKASLIIRDIYLSYVRDSLYSWDYALASSLVPKTFV